MLPIGMIISGLTQIALGVFALYMKLEINPVIGYRTKQSMLNEKTWIYGNQSFGKMLAICGLINVISGSYSAYLLQENDHLKMTITIVNFFILFIGLGIAIYLTERRLTILINSFKNEKIRIQNDIDRTQKD